MGDGDNFAITVSNSKDNKKNEKKKKWKNKRHNVTLFDPDHVDILLIQKVKISGILGGLLRILGVFSINWPYGLAEACALCF